jgi:hypothetical protein
MNLMGRKKGNIMLEKSWDKMSIEEQERVRKEEQEKFSRMYPIVASANAIHANTAAAARKMAIEYWKKNHPNGVTINTIIGDVDIDTKSIKDSLFHGLVQGKLDAVPTLKAGMEKAAYISTMKDFDGNPLQNHFFLYKTDFSGEENYVLCRIRTNDAKQRLYIHEVMKASEFVQQKSDALQSQLANGNHQQLRGIALYKNMITDFLKGVNGSFYPEQKEEKKMAVSNATMYHQEIANSLTVAEESLHEEDAAQLHRAVKNLHVSMEKVEEAEQTCGADQETWDGYAARHENIVRRIEAAGDARSEGKSEEECSDALIDAQESLREGTAYMEERCAAILRREKEYQEELAGLRARIEELEREREVRAQLPEELARCLAASTEFLAAVEDLRREAKAQPRIIASEMYSTSRRAVKDAYYSVKLAPTKVKNYLRQRAQKAIDGVLHSVASVFDEGIAALEQRRAGILRKSHEMQSASEFYRDALEEALKDSKSERSMETERTIARSMAKAGFGAYAIEKVLRAESPYRKEMEQGDAKNIAKDAVQETKEQREEKTR